MISANQALLLLFAMAFVCSLLPNVFGVRSVQLSQAAQQSSMAPSSVGYGAMSSHSASPEKGFYGKAS
jgi:hypothetical protein